MVDLLQIFFPNLKIVRGRGGSKSQRCVSVLYHQGNLKKICYS